jgi:hypothetical protein
MPLFLFNCLGALSKKKTVVLGRYTLAVKDSDVLIFSCWISLVASGIDSSPQYMVSSAPAYQTF